MKYYILSQEVEPKVVGVKDGVGQLKFDAKIKEKFNQWNYDIFIRLPKENKDWWKVWSAHQLYALKPLEGLIFRKGAKKTDFIGEGLRGFYVNEKLKNILESSHLPNHRFIKTPFIEEKTGEIIDEYWRFVYDLDTGENTVDFKKSEFDFRNYYGDFGQNFSRNISSYEDYLNVYTDTRRGLRASKLVFNERFDRELDFLTFTFLTPSLYISERLLTKMQDAGITGYSIMTLEKDKMRSEILGDIHTELVFE